MFVPHTSRLGLASWITTKGDIPCSRSLGDSKHQGEGIFLTPVSVHEGKVSAPQVLFIVCEQYTTCCRSYLPFIRMPRVGTPSLYTGDVDEMLPG